MPGWSSGISRNDSPLLPFDAGSVRASTKIQSESCASDVQTFWDTPRAIRILFGTRAHVGEVGTRAGPNTLGTRTVPARMPGRKRARWSSVPHATSVGPSSPSPMCPIRPPPARAYSSWKITCSATEAAPAGVRRPAGRSSRPSPVPAPTPCAVRATLPRRRGRRGISGMKSPVRCDCTQSATSCRNCCSRVSLFIAGPARAADGRDAIAAAGRTLRRDAMRRRRSHGSRSIRAVAACCRTAHPMPVRA